jgi:YbbR domain-containing protein
VDRWFRNVNVVRIISLLIGIFLWIVVHQQASVSPGNSTVIPREMTINGVVVSPKYDASQLYITSMDPKQVQVILRGNNSAIQKINTSNYKIELDLTKVGKGEHTIALNAVGFPSSVEVEIIPNVVKVTLEELQKKEVPVVIGVTGQPKAGLKAGQPIVKPNRVHVTLPASQLDEVESVRGEVSVDKAEATVTKQVKLQAYDKSGKLLAVDINPSVVDVEVPITSPFQVMPLQIKLDGEPAKGFAIASVLQSVDKITVYGEQQIISGMEFYEGPNLNIQDLNATKEYTLTIPIRNKVTEIVPTKVTVKVEVVPSVTRTFTDIPIQLIGQTDTHSASIIKPAGGKVSFTIEGAAAILDSMKLEDLNVSASISNLPDGIQDVDVVMNLPPYVKLISQSDPKVTVEVTTKQKIADGKVPSKGANSGTGGIAGTGSGAVTP